MRTSNSRKPKYVEPVKEVVRDAIPDPVKETEPEEPKDTRSEELKRSLIVAYEKIQEAKNIDDVSDSIANAVSNSLDAQDEKGKKGKRGKKADTKKKSPVLGILLIIVIIAVFGVVGKFVVYDNYLAPPEPTPTPVPYDYATAISELYANEDKSALVDTALDDIKDIRSKLEFEDLGNGELYSVYKELEALELFAKDVKVVEKYESPEIDLNDPNLSVELSRVIANTQKYANVAMSEDISSRVQFILSQANSYLSIKDSLSKISNYEEFTEESYLQDIEKIIYVKNKSELELLVNLQGLYKERYQLEKQLKELNTVEEGEEVDEDAIQQVNISIEAVNGRIGEVQMKIEMLLSGTQPTTQPIPEVPQPESTGAPAVEDTTAPTEP